MNAYDVIESAILEKYTEGLISLEDAVSMQNILTEAKGPRFKLSELEEIKNTKPAEYAGPKEIKKFVDKNYTKILQVAAILEKEPKNIAVAELKRIGVDIVALVASYAILTAGSAIMSPGLVTFSGFISISIVIFDMVAFTINVIRAVRGLLAAKILRDIKRALMKVKRDKLPKELANKVTDMITSIEDSEIIKKESVDIVARIQEAYINGELSDEQFVELMERADYMDDTDDSTDIMESFDHEMGLTDDSFGNLFENTDVNSLFDDGDDVGYNLNESFDNFDIDDWLED